MIYLRVEGMQNALQRFKTMPKFVSGAFIGASYLFACQVITAAMRLAPIVTGFLRSSRWVTKPPPEIERFAIVAGFSASYAVYVETNDRAFHPIGQSRFLREAYTRNMTDGPAVVARWTKRLLRQGQTVDNVNATHPTAPLARTHAVHLEARATHRRQKIYIRRRRATARRRHEGAALNWG